MNNRDLNHVAVVLSDDVFRMNHRLERQRIEANKMYYSQAVQIMTHNLKVIKFHHAIVQRFTQAAVKRSCLFPECW